MLRHFGIGREMKIIAIRPPPVVRARVPHAMELGATARLQEAQVNACGREVADRTRPAHRIAMLPIMISKPTAVPEQSLGWPGMLHGGQWNALAVLRESSPFTFDAPKAIHARVGKLVPLDVKLRSNGLAAIQADGKRASFHIFAFTRIRNDD